MTDDGTLWTTLHKYLPRRAWIPIADIFLIIKRRVVLDAEDMARVNSR